MAQNKVIKFYDTYGFICNILTIFHSLLPKFALKVCALCGFDWFWLILMVYAMKCTNIFVGDSNFKNKSQDCNGSIFLHLVNYWVIF